MTDILVQTTLEISTAALMSKVEQLSPEQRLEVLKLVNSLLNQNQPRKTIWDKIEDIIKDVPEEVWEELPIDGAQEHDHYLYGTPKKGE